MNPKALKEREAKLFLAKSKRKEKRHHRKSSSPKSHRRHRDSRRRRDSRRHSSKERSRSSSPSARRRKTWEVSPTVTPHQSTPLPSPALPTSPGQTSSVMEMPQPQVFSPTSQTSRPASGSPSIQAPQYPAFPALGADNTAFLNAMFTIFQQMAPGSAPTGPSGPLAFSLGAPAPLRPAPFMPFLPLGNLGSAPVSAPVAPEVSAPEVSAPSASGFRPVTLTGPSETPRRTSLHPAPGSTSKLPVAPDMASDGSGDRRRSSTSADAMSTPQIEERLHSRRRALRLLEEQEYQRVLEEGEIEDSGEGLHGLDTASGLDTSPEWDLSSPGEYTEAETPKSWTHSRRKYFHLVAWR
ncbi:hypothetical protein NDU88_004887 [Pleurodeles waltl]|uniref:Uncharacterized protein n=1 Tax=Pleurodeles waltl TaxID=8319 RepID=A0AAV7M8C9_PLEWA|nr:hypothetical protein NDU88_004887 [Pleurodeles waltl]